MSFGPLDGEPVGPRGLARRLGGAGQPRFSLCVMLTKWDEYRECLASYQARGFDETCCEYIVMDNSDGNRADAYVAMNEFLQAAQGDYIILSHQDILLLEDGRERLEALLDELTATDPDWALCGNAGHSDDGWPFTCISHPHGERDIVGAPFPAPVVSLDENFIVVRRLANLALSHDLRGFHHYGADLCTIADILGWRSYVIGFFLRHKSPGTTDDSYFRSRKAVVAKYRRALKPRWVHVITRFPFYISGGRFDSIVARMMNRAGVKLFKAPRGRDIDKPEKRARRDAARR